MASDNLELNDPGTLDFFCTKLCLLSEEIMFAGNVNRTFTILHISNSKTILLVNINELSQTHTTPLVT